MEVAEELARRYPVPMWQFTLSATPGQHRGDPAGPGGHRPRGVVLFQGHYHGHFEEGSSTWRARVAALERASPRA